jgi:glyoxylase-like metal-dependent hydrolase (beta-lactamase superfamily II)
MHDLDIYAVAIGHIDRISTTRSNEVREENDRRIDRLAAERGVHRIEIPTMFGAPVNCYLIVDRPLTLVDAGLNWGASLDALEAGLATHGYAVADIELVLLTHQHIDHTGLAEIIVRRSGAELAGHATLAGWLARLPESHAQDDDHVAARMVAHGVPETEVAEFQARASTIRWLGSHPTPTVVLHDGAEIVLRDRTLRAAHRPGHSPTDTLYIDPSHELVFTGDHLMAGARATPFLVSGPQASGNGAPDLGPARAMRASLDATAAIGPDRLGLPGHGAPFADVRAQALHVARRQRARGAALLERLDQPRTTAELRAGRFPRLSAARGYVGLFEVLAELSVLVDQRLVDRLPGTPVRWVADAAQAGTAPRM